MKRRETYLLNCTKLFRLLTRYRMADGTLRRHHGQGWRHRERPERLVQGTQQPALHLRPH